MKLITLSDMLELYCEDIDGSILTVNPQWHAMRLVDKA